MAKNWIAFVPFDGEAPYVNIGDEPHFALLEEGMPELRTEVNLMASGYLPHSSQGLFAKGEITPGGYVKFEDASGDRNAIADVVYAHMSRTASFVVEADATIASAGQAFEKIIADASSKRFKAKFLEMAAANDYEDVEKTYSEFIKSIDRQLDGLLNTTSKIPWLLNDGDVVDPEDKNKYLTAVLDNVIFGFAALGLSENFESQTASGIAPWQNVGNGLDLLVQVGPSLERYVDSFRPYVGQNEWDVIRARLDAPTSELVGKLPDIILQKFFMFLKTGEGDESFDDEKRFSLRNRVVEASPGPYSKLIDSINYNVSIGSSFVSLWNRYIREIQSVLKDYVFSAGNRLGIDYGYEMSYLESVLLPMPKEGVSSAKEARGELRSGFYKRYDVNSPNSDGGYRAVMNFFSLVFNQMMESNELFVGVNDLLAKGYGLYQAVVSWDVFSNRKVTDSYDYVKLDSKLVENLKKNPLEFWKHSDNYFSTQQIPWDNRDQLGPAIRLANETGDPEKVIAAASKIIMKNMRSKNTSFVGRNFGLGGRLIEGVPSVDPDKNRPDAWEFYELETEDDYANEGAVLDHCIGGGHGYYERSHVQGISKDFSVRFKGVPQVTFTIMNDPGSYVLSALHSWNNGLADYPTSFALRDLFAYLGVDTSEAAIGESKSEFYEDFLSGDPERYEKSRQITKNGGSGMLDPISHGAYWSTVKDIQAKGKYAYQRFIMPAVSDRAELEEYLNTYSPEEVLQGIQWAREKDQEHVDPDFGPMRENRQLIEVSSITSVNSIRIFSNLINLYGSWGWKDEELAQRIGEHAKKVIASDEPITDVFRNALSQTGRNLAPSSTLGLDPELREPVVNAIVKSFEEETLLTENRDEMLKEALENASKWAASGDEFRSEVLEILKMTGRKTDTPETLDDVLSKIVYWFFHGGKDSYQPVGNGEFAGSVEGLTSNAKSYARYVSEKLGIEIQGDPYFSGEVFFNTSPLYDFIDLIASRLYKSRDAANPSPEESIGEEFYDQAGAKDSAYYYVMMSFLRDAGMHQIARRAEEEKDPTAAEKIKSYHSERNVFRTTKTADGYIHYIISNSTRPNETIQKMVEFLLDDSISCGDLFNFVGSQSYATKNSLDIVSARTEIERWRRSFIKDPGAGGYLFYEDFYSNSNLLQREFKHPDFNLEQSDINGDSIAIEIEDGILPANPSPEEIKNVKDKYVGRIYQKTKEDYALYIEDNQLPLFQEVERPEWWLNNTNKKQPIFLDGQVYEYPVLSPASTLSQIQQAAESTFIKITYDIAEIVAEKSSDPAAMEVFGNAIKREDWKRLYNTLGTGLHHLDNDDLEFVLQFARGKIDDTLLDMWAKTFSIKKPFGHFPGDRTLAEIASPSNLVPAQYNKFTNEHIVAVGGYDVLGYTGSIFPYSSGEPDEQPRMKSLLESFGISSEYFEEGYRQGLATLWSVIGGSNLRNNFPAIGYIEEYAAWVQIAMRDNASDMMALGVTGYGEQIELAKSLSTLSGMKIEPPDARESQFYAEGDGYTLGDKNMAILKANNLVWNGPFGDVKYADVDAGLRHCGECNGDGVEFSLDKICPACDGTGLEADSTCDNCEGSGEVNVECHECDGDQTLTCRNCEGVGNFECMNCDGTGALAGEECGVCDGNGLEACGECDGNGQEICYTCDTDGRVTDTCPVCDGEGVL